MGRSTGGSGHVGSGRLYGLAPLDVASNESPRLLDAEEKIYVRRFFGFC